MIMNTLIRNATIVNEGTTFVSDVLIEGEIIRRIAKDISDFPRNTSTD